MHLMCIYDLNKAKYHHLTSFFLQNKTICKGKHACTVESD